MPNHEVENPIAAAPKTAPHWLAWLASVTAGVAVILITSAWIWTASRLVNAVDRETCETNTARAVQSHRDETDRTLTTQTKRIEAAETQARENHGVLIELRTKVDLILQRLKQ